MKKTVYTLLLIATFSLGAFAQVEQSVNFKKLDQYFKQMVKDWDVPGASIGIVKNGELMFSGNYGVKEIGKKETPNQQTLYAIASNSKAFTSTLIGILVQEGKLNWNDPVKKHLPYFAVYDPWVSEHVTIEDLLSHRVGLGTFSGDNIWYKSELSAEEIIKRIQFVPQAFDFRAGYGYSNLMFITAGEVIRTVTGKSWADNVQERILKPLGMNRTVSQLNRIYEKGNYATPHARKEDDNYIIPWTNWDKVAATGGLISSVEDMSKWMIFNLNHGILGNDTILSKETRNKVWTPHNNRKVDHTTKGGTTTHFKAYGLGWGISDYRGRFRVSHTGGYDGMITAVTLLPDENLGVVVLTNGVKSPITAASYSALDFMLGIEEKDWSKDLLESTNSYHKKDTRIADRKAKRVKNTQPTVALENMLGDYHSDLYGKISLRQKNGKLKLEFEHSPLLTATLTHWHYNVWEITWDHPQAWFSFGTLQIKTDNNLKVIGFDFDVPNDDFFFNEFKPRKLH